MNMYFLFVKHFLLVWKVLMDDINVKFIICTFFKMFKIEECTVLQIFCPVLSDFDLKNLLLF